MIGSIGVQRDAKQCGAVLSSHCLGTNFAQMTNVELIGAPTTSVLCLGCLARVQWAFVDTRFPRVTSDVEPKVASMVRQTLQPPLQTILSESSLVDMIIKCRKDSHCVDWSDDSFQHIPPEKSENVALLLNPFRLPSFVIGEFSPASSTAP
eukprot:6473370-Amphidinium_carterae.1